DDHPVHPVGARAERTAQPGGAELEAAGERVGEFVAGGVVPGLHRGHQPLDLSAALRVGVPVRPGLRGVDQGVDGSRAGAHSIAPAIRLSSRRSTGAASLPAWMTSAWSSGVGLIPAAALVTSEIANTSIPASRAAIVSSAVDIPTRSAPSTLAIRTSAGVS